jgi:asparagine N-glycosylation enzyme membrane subunit Stt3
MNTLCLRTIKAGMTYFSLTFGAGFVLGAIRVPFLVPRLGERAAELLEMPLMFIVIVLAARFTAERFALPATVLVRLSTGLLALGLLIAAELFLAVGLQDRSLGDYVSSRDPVSGSVYLAMLALFAAMPFLITRLRFGRDHA